jgi:hypothetical protein
MRTAEIGVIVLLVLVVAGAWYAGLATDLGQFLGGANRIALTLQGRNQQGNFPSYPGGAPQVSAVGFGG